MVLLVKPKERKHYPATNSTKKSLYTFKQREIINMLPKWTCWKNKCIKINQLQV